MHLTAGRLDMRELVKSCKALSDETRLRVLNVLMERDCCVSEVRQALQISQARASRSLSTLYDAGFLRLRRRGLWSLYSIEKESLQKYSVDLIEGVRKALKDDETALLDRHRLEGGKRLGPDQVCKP